MQQPPQRHNVDEADVEVDSNDDRYADSLPETCSYYVDQIEGFLESIAEMKGGASGGVLR